MFMGLVFVMKISMIYSHIFFLDYWHNNKDKFTRAWSIICFQTYNKDKFTRAWSVIRFQVITLFTSTFERSRFVVTDHIASTIFHRAFVHVYKERKCIYLVIHSHLSTLWYNVVFAIYVYLLAILYCSYLNMFYDRAPNYIHQHIGIQMTQACWHKSDYNRHC